MLSVSTPLIFWNITEPSTETQGCDYCQSTLLLPVHLNKVTVWENKMGGERKDGTTFASWQNLLQWKCIFVYVTKNKE